MAELTIPNFIQNYMNEIHETDATRRFVKLAGDYQNAIDKTHISGPKQAESAAFYEKVTGKKAHIQTIQEKLVALEKDFKKKAKEIAKDYIKDPQVLDAINPEIEPEQKPEIEIPDETDKERAKRQFKEAMKMTQRDQAHEQ